MTTLIEAYEAKHYPLNLPDPVEAIKFEMERKGLTVKDLEPMIGKSNRVYEILNHKRSLTLKMIWKLHKGLGIPAESLIKQPQTHVNIFNPEIINFFDETRSESNYSCIMDSRGKINVIGSIEEAIKPLTS